MNSGNKIINSLSELKKFIKEVRVQGIKISLCQGHFNVIHIGHLRFLDFAKKHGDIMLVAVQGQKVLDSTLRNKFYGAEERLYGVSLLGMVDKAFIYNDIPFSEILKIVRPAFYIMGEEFLNNEEIKSDINLVENFGGKVIFSSGDITYSSTEILEKDILDLRDERKQAFKVALEKQKIRITRLFEIIESFKNCRLLVVGDTIVDQYVACDALGMSSEAPVLVLKEIESKEFVGGAAVVSRHLVSFKANCSFISVIGDDSPGKLVKKELEEIGVKASLFVDDERPTIFKIRYLVESQKILRVSRLTDTHINRRIEEKVINEINRLSERLDGIIVSDFVYGIITPNILDCIQENSKKYNLMLFGDSQSSSQVGDISKFQNYHLITPTEKEARISWNNKYSGLEKIGTSLLKQTNSKNLLLKLGSEGFIAFTRTDDERFCKSQHFPALNAYPIDVMGAGDSLLTAVSLSMCAGADLMEASAIGAITASIAVNKMGNVPVSIDEVKKCLSQI